jgi:hypothetical protein
LVFSCWDYVFIREGKNVFVGVVWDSDFLFGLVRGS